MAIDSVISNYLVTHNLRIGTSLENKVTFRLHRLGLLERQQYRAGKYRLDFAWPGLSVALEVDGPHHWRPDVAMKDAVRDSWLRSVGWLVFRVDEMHGSDSLENQLCRFMVTLQCLKSGV